MKHKMQPLKAKVPKSAAKEIGEDGFEDYKIPKVVNITKEVPTPIAVNTTNSTEDQENVKKAVDKITELKSYDPIAEGSLKRIMKEASSTPEIIHDSIKDDIKKAVEETVKQEVANLTSGVANNCTVPTPLSAEEKKDLIKTKKIQDEIAKEIRQKGIDKKATREVEAKEKQAELQKVNHKLQKEIQKSENEQQQAQSKANQLKQHQSEVSKALKDTKEFRKANKMNDNMRHMATGMVNSDAYETQGDDEDVHGGYAYYKHPHRDHSSYPSQKKFWREKNDDDNNLVPELKGPPKKGKSDIDGEDEDKPRFTKSEEENWKKLMKEAKE